VGDRVQFFVCFTKKIEDDWGPSMAFTTGSANMSDYEDDLAENWEGVGRGAVGGGGKKYKAKPTHVGRVRVGGNAWGGAEKACPKNCAKKCCKVAGKR